MHDIYEPADPPHRREIPIYRPSDRIGSPIVTVDPSKIVGVVVTDLEDEARGFSEADAAHRADRQQRGRVPGLRSCRSGPHPQELPAASSPAWATSPTPCSAPSARNPDIPAFEMYTEVLQDSVVDLLAAERVTFASSCSLTLSPER